MPADDEGRGGSWKSAKLEMGGENQTPGYMGGTLRKLT